MARRKECTCKIEVPSTKGEFELFVTFVMRAQPFWLMWLFCSRSSCSRGFDQHTLVPLASLASTTLFSRQRSVVHGIITLSTTDTDGFFCGRPGCHNPCCRRTTHAMCPSSGLVPPDGNGSPGTGVPGAGSSTDQVIREMSAQFTGVQRKLSELPFAANTTADWMRQHDARAFEIDKSLSSLRGRLEAILSAPVSTVETKSVMSDWPLPLAASSVGSGTQNRGPPSPTPGVGGTDQPSPVQKLKTSCSAHTVPDSWYDQGDETERSAVLVKFPCGHNKGTIDKFYQRDFSNTCPTSHKVKCKKKQRRMFAVCFSPKVLASNSFSGHSLTYSTFNPLAVKKSADIFARQALERTSNRETPVSPLEGCP